MSNQLPDELRHAFRALLRAATYLPDATARWYIRSYAVHRFRTVADKIKSTKIHDSEQLIAKYHDQKRIAKVWQTVHQLERAGQGSEPDLKKALFLTYGRRGKRRRELIQDLLRPGEHTFPEDQAALQKLIEQSSEKEQHGQKENPKLLAFIRSQQLSHPIDSPRNKIRHSKPQIPEENIWGRPVPLKRQANIKKKFWADTLDKLMPPVPKYEWDRLRDLATGAIPTEGPPPRRSRSGEVESNDHKLWEYFSMPANRQESEMKNIAFTANEIVTLWETRSELHKKDIRTITPRYMRRLYATIWSITPTMVQDDVTKAWIIKWGGTRSAAHGGRVTAPSKRDIELFEGADEKVKAAEVKPKDLKRRAKKQRMLQKNSLPMMSLWKEGYTQGVVPAI